MEEEENAKMQAGDLGSLIPGFLGLGAQIGTAIPGLRKPVRTNAAEGAILAATTGAARAAAGAGAAGYGATRGLATREAGRQAQQILLSAAPSIVQAANQDEIRFQREMQDRNARLASFGSTLASGMSTLGAGIGTMVGSDDQASPAAGQMPSMVIQDPTTGLGPEPPMTAAPAQAAMPAQGPATPGGQMIDEALTQDPGAAPAAPAAPQTPPQGAPPLAAAPQMGATHPDLLPASYAQTRALEGAQLAQNLGLDPNMMAMYSAQVVPNPILNPSAILNPYLV